MKEKREILHLILNIDNKIKLNLGLIFQKIFEHTYGVKKSFIFVLSE